MHFFPKRWRTEIEEADCENGAVGAWEAGHYDKACAVVIGSSG